MLGTRNVIPFITKIGYLPFNDGFDSDHRAIFADISPTILEYETPITEPKIRLVGSNSTNTESKRYIRHLHNRLSKKNIFSSVEELYILSKNQYNDLVRQEIMDKLNALDNIITEYMLTSEQSTCCLKDRVLWSPEIEQANFICQYWCVVYRARQQQIDASRRIDNIWEKLNNESKQSIIDNTISLWMVLKQSLIKHNELCKNHQQLRDNHLQRKVDEFNEREDTKEVMNIEKLMRRERKRQDHAFIRKILKNNKSKGLTVLEIPSATTPGAYTRITDRDEIKRYLLIRNVTHFGLANNTAFSQPPLLNFFQYEGINADTENLILNGIIPLEIQGQPPHVHM
jgi:hypothetical protein